jgi:hypothetical protein
VVVARQAIRGSRGGSAFYHASSHRPSLSGSGIAELVGMDALESRYSVVSLLLADTKPRTRLNE